MHKKSLYLQFSWIQKQRKKGLLSNDLQIVDGAVMNVTRSVIVVVVSKNNAMSTLSQITAILCPIKHST